MTDGIHVRLQYKDEICFEQKFRAISGDTIVLHIDEFLDKKAAAEREACAQICEKYYTYYGYQYMADDIRARGQQ